MEMTPAIAIHVTAALGAVATGPVALWARKGRTQRPKLHRGFGYAWVTLMVITALSALFIRPGRLPSIAGFSPIHLLIPITLFGLFGAFYMLAQGRIERHGQIMQYLYVGACAIAGAFTLLPGRFLGELLWVDLLGLLPPHVHPAPSTATQGPSMIYQILSNTPVWVWGLLAGLLALGFSQARDRTAGMTRIVLMPLGLGGFSLYGTMSAFGATAPVLGAWSAATLLLLLIVTQFEVPAGTSYDTATSQFALPGSWVPMLLIMGIFLTKYAVGVSLAIRPELAANGNFVLAISTVYGVFSGIFAGRTARLLRLAQRPAGTATPALNP